jgi:hypothetical protein
LGERALRATSLGLAMSKWVNMMAAAVVTVLMIILGRR